MLNKERSVVGRSSATTEAKRFTTRVGAFSSLVALKNLFTILYFMFVAFEDESRGLRADARRPGSTGQEGHQVAFRNDQTKCF